MTKYGELKLLANKEGVLIDTLIEDNAMGDLVHRNIVHSPH